MRVTKVGFINEDRELVGEMPHDVMGLLINAVPPQPTTTIIVFFSLDKGMYSKPLPISIPIAEAVLESQLATPQSLVYGESFTRLDTAHRVGLYAFKNHVFKVEVEQANAEAEERVFLLIKKQVYDQDSKWRKLKEEVELMERVVGPSAGIKRTAIPEAVKLFVFTRDEGRCVRCGSNSKLHFDHIIPVAKGGDNSPENIQVLCEPCNLKKSDHISF